MTYDVFLILYHNAYHYAVETYKKLASIINGCVALSFKTQKLQFRT